MNQEDIVRMAREAGFRTGHTQFFNGAKEVRFIEPIGDSCMVELERFAALVRADEREACAKVCEESEARFELLWNRLELPCDQGAADACRQLSAAIRARGETK